MTTPHPNTTKPATGPQILYAHRREALHAKLRNWLKKTGQLK